MDRIGRAGPHLRRSPFALPFNPVRFALPSCWALHKRPDEAAMEELLAALADGGRFPGIEGHAPCNKNWSVKCHDKLILRYVF